MAGGDFGATPAPAAGGQHRWLGIKLVGLAGETARGEAHWDRARKRFVFRCPLCLHGRWETDSFQALVEHAVAAHGFEEMI